MAKQLGNTLYVRPLAGSGGLVEESCCVVAAAGPSPPPPPCILTTLAPFTASPGSPFSGTQGRGVAYGNGQWVDVRSGSTGTNILYSLDPSVSWADSPGQPFGTGSGEGIAYGNGNWVAVGAATGGNNILYSIDPDRKSVV